MRAIKFTRDSLKFAKNLETKQARQVYEKALALTQDPRPQSATELRGYKGCLRLKVGSFRIIYRVPPEAIEILIIDNRGDDEVYRHLDRISWAS